MENLKKILIDGEYTCVLSDGNEFITSKERGVKPLLTLVNQNANLKNFCAADKVVGKAAAFLYVLLGVKSVYAITISKYALSVFQKYNINVTYDIVTDAILNRKGDGFCPMESAVLNIDNPGDALKCINKKTEELKK